MSGAMGAGPLPDAAVSALEQGNKIEAIKLVREAHGLDLKDSKQRVEAFIATRPDLAGAFAEKGARVRRIVLVIAVLSILEAIFLAWFFLR